MTTPIKTRLATVIQSVILNSDRGFAESVTVNGETMTAIVVRNYAGEQFEQAEIESELAAITVETADLAVAGADIGDPVVLDPSGTPETFTIKNRRDRNSGLSRLVLAAT